MTRTRIAAAAAAGSALLLCGAFVFQALGYPPCKMCLWQRWPHVVAVLCGFGYIWLHKRNFLWAGAAAALSTAAIGLYHAGVEQRWWEGPSSCSSGSVGGLNGHLHGRMECHHLAGAGRPLVKRRPVAPPHRLTPFPEPQHRPCPLPLYAVCAIGRDNYCTAKEQERIQRERHAGNP